jgi:hypothetical protein
MMDVITISKLSLLPQTLDGHAVHYQAFAGKEEDCKRQAEAKSWLGFVRIGYYMPANQTLYVPVCKEYTEARK